MGLALLWLPASEAALIAYTMPIWASILAWPILGERPNLLRVISLVMAFAGLAAIMGGNGFAASMAKLPGIIMALGGAVGFAVGTVLAKKLPLNLPPLSAAAWQIGIGCFPITLVGLLIEKADVAAISNLGLVPASVFDRDPVLRRLCQLVRGARAAAGLGGGDRHHGGAGDRRGRLGAGAARAARPRPGRGLAVHAGRRRAGDAIMTAPRSARAASPDVARWPSSISRSPSVGWGVNFPIMKHLLQEWPPLSSRGLCGIAGAAALALIALARRQSLAVPRPMWSRLVLVSLLTIGGWVAFMGLALLWLSASEAAVLGISIPVWVALLAWPILGERLSLLRAVSMAIALAGIAVLIGGNGLDASLAKLPGLLCVLAGAVCVALGTVLTKHFPLAMPPLVAGGLADRYRMPADRRSSGLRSSSRSSRRSRASAGRRWPIMTLIQFCLCYVCWFAALERLPAATASIGTLLVPVIGVLAAAAMLHEPLGLREIAALVFTLGGVGLALRS